MAKKSTVQKPIDITKTGPQGFKQLQAQNAANLKGLSPEFQEFNANVEAHSAPTSLYDAREHAEKNINSSLGQSNTPWGQSMFDNPTATEEQFQNLGDIRAQNEPWYAKISAGIAKGAVLAGTTFLDGTIGLVLGGAQAIAEGRASAIWDNPFSKAMQDINKASEEVLPNYYTKQEQESPWYDNIFTANFLGDKFIKNLGFTVGAFYSGSVWTKPLTLGGKLATTIARVSELSEAPKIITSGIGATISAVNEGRQEALNNSTDWFNLHKAQLDDYHQQRLQAISQQYQGTEMYDKLINSENNAYNQTLGKLSEDRLKMGNIDLLMNIPILTASNLIQFGKMYANGFKTARKVTNIVGKAGEYTAASSKLGAALSITKGALSEGTEEALQQAASNISGDYYSTDVHNFYKAKTDPKASRETLEWTKAFAQGINDTVNDGSTWEQFFIGSLTGALGMPKFRSVRDSEGNVQSPVTIEGGAIGEWKDYNEKRMRDNQIADYMNQRVNSPEFKNYYQGLIRHNKYQGDMNAAAKNNDEFSYKNAEHAQLVSDVAMFDNAGKLDDLNTLINSAYDTSDENLQSIVENTTTTTEDGKKVGPFIDANGNPMYSTEDGKNEMIDKLTQSKDDMLKTISDYTKIKDSIDVRTGQKLSDDQLEELTWMKSQLGNWSQRAQDMSGQIKDPIGKVIWDLSSLVSFNQKIRDFEGQHNAGLTDAYNKADSNLQSLQKVINTLDAVRNSNSNDLVYTLASNPKFVTGLKDAISNIDEQFLNADDKQDVNNKLDDIVKLGNASKTYNAKLKEYLQNPSKQVEEHVKATEDNIKEEIKQKTDSLKDTLSAATNLSEFKDALDNSEDDDTKEQTLKTMEEEGSELAKNYRETTQYSNEVRRAINSMEADPQAKQDALKLLQDHISNSENLQDTANPQSVHINNEHAFDEDSEGDLDESTRRFQEAQYLAQTAMTKVNNDDRFKNRFSSEYKQPIQKVEHANSARGTSKSSTGDSGTATVPSVNGQAINPRTDTPVGDIPHRSVIEENNDTNQKLAQDNIPSKEDNRKYYRPAIPELHIEASKQGDFRPFNQVVAEREKGVNFDAIYDYLKDAGAFSYLNDGNLSVGDELGFMIDPEFNDHTIFIVDKKNNQIVGSLDESEYSVSRYEGLAGLEERIREEYKAKGNKSKFIATPTVRVSQLMVGRIPYSSEERNLKDISNIGNKENPPIFGIIKNGTLSTNGKIDDSLVLKPTDMSQKEGRMYLLIKNGKGTYSPAAVRVKHFNAKEFNLKDATVSETPMAKHIAESINKLASVQNNDDLTEAVKSLGRDLYIGDVHIDWVSSEQGNAIRFTKVERDAQGREIYTDELTPQGKKKRKEQVGIVFLTEKDNVLFSFEDNGPATPGGDTSKSIEEIATQIQDVLQGFNLPIQVNLGMLNEGGYNNMLVSSDILTSNITNAKVYSTWFTTDYFDSKGELHTATSPTSITPQAAKKVETPVGGKEGVINGIQINTAEKDTLWVNLKSNSIIDKQGVDITKNYSKEQIQVYLEQAWAQNLFGDKTESSIMTDNKVITPSGKVLNRSTGAYLTDSQAQKVKDAIANKDKATQTKIADSKKVIGKIYENQKKVNKTMTDGDYYYIMEDDGQYHPYTRVHGVLGNNWVQSPKQEEALTNVRTNLSKFSDNTTQFDAYLAKIGKHFDVDLTPFMGKTDTRNRSTVVNIIRDKMAGTNSQRALNAGTAVDSIIRNFFTSNQEAVKPANMSDEAFNSLISRLTEIRSNIEQTGERFLADNIVLYQHYQDGTRIAGEVDILSVDKDGNFKIYDVKTSKYSFHDFRDKYGHTQNYFKNKSKTMNMSSKDYYTLQLSAYKNLFESQYRTPVTTLAILPFVLTYNKEEVSGVTGEKGIPITYNPAVKVPLVSAVTATTSPIVPIFNSTLETQKPKNLILPEYNLSLAKTTRGYFMLDGVITNGYIAPIGKVGDTEVYMTKVPNITRGLGSKGEAHVASNSYYAVFPNGQTVKILANSVNDTDESAATKIFEALKANSQRVTDESNVETPILKVANATPAKPSGASITAQAEQAIIPHDDEFDDGELRQVDNTNNPVWDQKQELDWLNKVLPQMVQEDRVKIVSGLINVASKGALAWGQFSKGVITLSDIAAKGTVYHEAFHAVFHLMMEESERIALLKEASTIYGSKSNRALEEDMAEGFREYVMTRENMGLGKRIIQFFKDLYIKVTNWNKVQPHLIAYYQQINKGKYVSSTFNTGTFNAESDDIRYREVPKVTNFTSLDSETKEILTKKGWTEDKFNSISQQEKDQILKCLAF